MIVLENQGREEEVGKRVCYLVEATHIAKIIGAALTQKQSIRNAGKRTSRLFLSHGDRWDGVVSGGCVCFHVHENSELEVIIYHVYLR